MSMRSQYTLEIGSGSATLAFSGTLSRSDVPSLRVVCRQIPEEIRSLYLDLRNVTHLDGLPLETVRALLRDWQDACGRIFQVTLGTRYLVATYSAGALNRGTIMRVNARGVEMAPAAETCSEGAGSL